MEIRSVILIDPKQENFGLILTEDGEKKVHLCLFLFSVCKLLVTTVKLVSKMKAWCFKPIQKPKSTAIAVESNGSLNFSLQS